MIGYANFVWDASTPLSHWGWPVGTAACYLTVVLLWASGLQKRPTPAAQVRVTSKRPLLSAASNALADRSAWFSVLSATLWPARLSVSHASTTDVSALVPSPCGGGGGGGGGGQVAANDELLKPFRLVHNLILCFGSASCHTLPPTRLQHSCSSCRQPLAGGFRHPCRLLPALFDQLQRCWSSWLSFARSQPTAVVLWFLCLAGHHAASAAAGCCCPLLSAWRTCTGGRTATAR